MPASCFQQVWLTCSLISLPLYHSFAGFQKIRCEENILTWRQQVLGPTTGRLPTFAGFDWLLRMETCKVSVLVLIQGLHNDINRSLDSGHLFFDAVITKNSTATHIRRLPSPPDQNFGYPRGEVYTARCRIE